MSFIQKYSRVFDGQECLNKYFIIVACFRVVIIFFSRENSWQENIQFSMGIF